MRRAALVVVFSFMTGISSAASVQDLMTIAHNPSFQDRVKYAMQSAAIAVMAEDAQTVAHPARVAYATSILAGRAAVDQFTIGVVNNSTIAAEADVSKGSGFSIPDGDIQFTVNSEFNAFAGVAN